MLWTKGTFGVEMAEADCRSPRACEAHDVLGGGGTDDSVPGTVRLSDLGADTCIDQLLFEHVV